MVVSANNPTGVVYPKSLLKEINRLCADQNIYHISDEVYEYFIYDQATHVSPAIFDPMIDSTVSLFSCSKSFGMAGYRIGYMVYPDHLKDEILKVQDTIGICAPVPSQYAAIEAIKLGFSYMKPFLPEISQIRTRFFRSLSDIDSIDVNLPQGSLYFFIHFKDKNLHDTAIAKMLIDSYKVVSLPGSIFDADFPSLRISFGNLRLEHSIRGCERLTNGLTEILKQV
jgi:aspartate/methionine/tyrosine aminotransferase